MGAQTANAADPLLAPPGACAGDETTAGSTAAQERTMRCLVNQARARAGLRTLRADRRLRFSAALKNGLMVRCGQFSHTPCGEPFMKTFRAAHFLLGAGGAVAENIAYGGSYLGAPRNIMSMWLASPGHRANLLNPAWSRHGVAVHHGPFLGERSAAVWASQFANR